MAGVLDGVRVVDFTQMMAGPVCPSLLGDMGADVIKIEPPEGDGMRSMGDVRLGGESDLFISVNRNKRSVVLDLKTPEGQRAARTMASCADVVVENFRPGTAERLGVGYDAIRELNPSVIYCSITGFGRDGPDRNRAALDPVMQAISGIMSVTGDETTGPLCTGIPVSDFVTPVFATIGVLGALFARERTGAGQRIDLSMIDASIFALMPRESYVLATGSEPARLGNRHFEVVPYNTYQTRDERAIMVLAHNDKFWNALLEALECQDMANDPRFSSNGARKQHRELLEERFVEVFRSRDMDDWLERLARADAIFAPVRSLRDVLSDERVKRDVLVEVEHATAGRISVLGNPIRYSETPMSVHAPPPTLGQHTESVMKQLELSDDWPGADS
jgi:CoA:oxalate CoA-transferase